MKVVLPFLAVFLVATNQDRPEAYPQDYVAGIAAVQAPETNKIMPKKSSRADHPVIFGDEKGGKVEPFVVWYVLLFVGHPTQLTDELPTPNCLLKSNDSTGKEEEQFQLLRVSCIGCCFFKGVLLWLPPCKLKLADFKRLPLVKMMKDTQIICAHC